MSNVVLSRELQVSDSSFAHLSVWMWEEKQYFLNVNEECGQYMLLPEIYILFIFGFKGMVEVVAENYHNIWAKKKKIDLGSRGELLMNSIMDAYWRVTPAKQDESVCVWVDW